MIVVEQTGRIMVVRGGRKLVAAVPRPRAEDRVRRRAGPAVGRVRARLRAQRRFYVYYTAATARDNRIVEYRRTRAPTGRTRRARALVLTMPNLEVQPQRRAAALRPRRPDVRRHRRRRRGERPARRRAATPRPRVAARQDPADRPARRRAVGPYRIPSSNPFVGRAGRPRRDLRLRPAQPVALLVRPQHRRPRHRRRRPGRSSRRSTSSAAAAGAARTSAGGRSRATGGTSSTSRPRARSRPVIMHTHAPGWCSITGGYVVRDPASRPRRPLRLRRRLRGPHPRRPACGPGRRTPAACSTSRRVERPLVVRRGRPGARLRRVAERAGLPARGALRR